MEILTQNRSPSSRKTGVPTALAILLALAVVIATDHQPSLAQAGRPTKRVGILASTWCPERESPKRDDLLPMLTSLTNRGWIEGRNLIVDCVAAGGRLQELPVLAAGLVARKPDVLVGESTPVVRALKQATTKIPIVTAGPDPLASGIVTHLAHPEANVTGLAPMSIDLVAKRTELLRDLLPRLSRLAVILRAADPVDHDRIQEDVSAAGAALGFTWKIFDPPTVTDVGELFENISAEGYDAVYVVSSPLLYLYKGSIIEASLKYRIPTISESTEYTRLGLLLSYGLQSRDLMEHAADYVDQLLRGAKPADLPLQQPTKFELVINLRIAKVLGLTVPESILLRADEVIE
jgi:putative tryptophan/tyrosine transport system substrate-binding protein